MAAGIKMNLAILFWLYKEPELCRHRVQHLRRYNSQTPIYALFGGDSKDAPKYEAALRDYIDDFYVFDEPPPPGADGSISEFRGGVHWKYLYGDLLISSWYKHRGKKFEWDTIVVVQWDMLLFGAISEVFSCLEKDQILLSGLRPIREVESNWAWVTPKNAAARARYLEFLEYVQTRYGYSADPLCCLSIITCYPRSFLNEFSQIERPELGFLEYKLPIYAQIFRTPICTNHPFKPWWAAVEPFESSSTLRARPVEIGLPTIVSNLMKTNGARVFHPYWHEIPTGPVQWSAALLKWYLWPQRRGKNTNTLFL